MTLDTSGTLLLQELAEGKKTDEETMTYIGLDHTQSNRVVRRYIYIDMYIQVYRVSSYIFIISLRTDYPS